MARHTLATTVTLSNGVPIETVSKVLGHTKIATTQIHARVLEKKVSDDMNALKKVLDLNKNKGVNLSPSNRLEKLTGKLNEFYSIRINKQWRIIFIWKNGSASEVEIIDYH